MATRSTIAIEHADGTVEQVYCHWDGYIEHNGKILQEHYTDRSKVEQLIAGGSISILAEEIGEEQDFNNPIEGWTVYYRRDRGELGNFPNKFASLAEYLAKAQKEEFNYIFTQDDVWSVDGKNDWQDLELLLQEREAAA